MGLLSHRADLDLGKLSGVRGFTEFLYTTRDKMGTLQKQLCYIS